MTRTIRQFAPLLLIATLVFAVAASPDSRPATLFQVSTLQALLQGQYDGTTTLKDALAHGNTGLGTFDALDGELIVMDGVAYQVTVDGKVHPATPEMTTPFLNLAFLDPTHAKHQGAIHIQDGLDALHAQALSAIMQTPDATRVNRPWIFRFDGTFTGVRVRSVPRQTKPYPPLKEAAAHQKIYTQETVKGSIVGFFFPTYMSGINLTGFHLHAISDDRTFGGHLLAIDTLEGTYTAQPLDGLHVTLPSALDGMDIHQDMTKDIHAIERAPAHE